MDPLGSRRPCAAHSLQCRPWRRAGAAHGPKTPLPRSVREYAPPDKAGYTCDGRRPADASTSGQMRLGMFALAIARVVEYRRRWAPAAKGPRETARPPSARTPISRRAGSTRLRKLSADIFPGVELRTLTQACPTCLFSTVRSDYLTPVRQADQLHSGATGRQDVGDPVSHAECPRGSKEAGRDVEVPG